MDYAVRDYAAINLIEELLSTVSPIALFACYGGQKNPVITGLDLPNKSLDDLVAGPGSDNPKVIVVKTTAAVCPR